MISKSIKYIAMTFACFVSQTYGQTDLEIYLEQREVEVKEGYCTEAQLAQFDEVLNSRRDEILHILEIGFNAGHSAEFFLESCPNAQVVSFDLNGYPYTEIGRDFIQQKYKERFVFVEGNSIQTIPAFAKANPLLKFDLIYIDGDHNFSGCYKDIVNCKLLADANTLLWIDDYHYRTVARVIAHCVQKGLISIENIQKCYDSQNAKRYWVEAKYLFPVAKESGKEVSN